MKYRIKTIFVFVMLWEITFWVLFYFITELMGVFSRGGASDKMLFKYPEYLQLLFVLIPIGLFYFYHLHRYNRMASGAAGKITRSYLAPVSSLRSFLRYFLFRNAFVFLILTLAQPVFGKKKVSGTSESMELVICLDISNSMNTRDISDEASRLEIAKRALIQLVNNLHGERIGICLFANNAFVQLPVTRDYSASKLFINEIETNMISSQGTNIDAALKTALEMFSKDRVAKGIIVVTDGENHESNPSEVLVKIKEEKIQLSILGIGTTRGGLVPKDPDRPELGYKQNALGKSVVSKLNEKFIRDLASKGNGYANITSSEFPDLSALLTQIKHMKRTKIDNLDFDIKEERYQVTLFISVLFWIAYILLPKTFFRKKV